MLKKWPEHDLNMEWILNHAHLGLMRSLLSLVIPLDCSSRGMQDVCCNGDRLCKGELALAIVLGKRARKSPERDCSWKTRQKVSWYFQVFRVQKTISCLLMFTHVQHVQHVLSLFRACSQGLNMLNMQLTVKMAIIFLIMFHFSILCSVSSAPKIKWKGKVSYGLHHSSPPATGTYWDHPAQNPAQNCWDHPAQNGRSGKELLPDGQVW